MCRPNSNLCFHYALWLTPSWPKTVVARLCILDRKYNQRLSRKENRTVQADIIVRSRRLHWLGRVKVTTGYQNALTDGRRKDFAGDEVDHGKRGEARLQTAWQSWNSAGKAWQQQQAASSWIQAANNATKCNLDPISDYSARQDAQPGQEDYSKYCSCWHNTVEQCKL